MIEIGTYVKLIKENIKGYVVDIREEENEYTIEGEERNKNGIFDLYDCPANDVVIA